jgi:hypothetical protein
MDIIIRLYSVHSIIFARSIQLVSPAVRALRVSRKAGIKDPGPATPDFSAAHSEAMLYKRILRLGFFIERKFIRSQSG